MPNFRSFIILAKLNRLRLSAITNQYLVLFSLFLPLNCIATNGINAIGFGAESVGMGGADIALSRDTSALNSNPAGLSQIKNQRLDISPFIAHNIDVFHRDTLGNDEDNNNTPLFGANFGYANRINDTNLVLGIGLFAQGGAGAEFENLNTIFGSQDELSALLGIIRITPGFAYSVNDKFSIGANLIVSISSQEQNIFPDTSFFNPLDPSQSFFGAHFDDLVAVGTGFKVGTLIHLSDNTTLGLAYTSKVKLEQEDGILESNQSAIGLGIVNYQDASISGINTPEEIGIGLATRINEKLLLSAEINWLNWSDAIQTVTTIAREPDNPFAIPEIRQITPQDWDDQWVFAIGAEYITQSDYILRVGYNYGKSPVPLENFFPLTGGNFEHHVTAGIAKNFNEKWRLTGSMEYLVDNTVTYTNPNTPLGINVSNGGNVIAFQIMLSRFW